MIRWTARRKAALLAAITVGELTEAEACRCHELTTEELAEWRRGFEAHGLAGLQVSRIQLFRAEREGG